MMVFMNATGHSVCRHIVPQRVQGVLRKGLWFSSIVCSEPCYLLGSWTFRLRAHLVVVQHKCPTRLAGPEHDLPRKAEGCMCIDGNAIRADILSTRKLIQLGIKIIL